MTACLAAVPWVLASGNPFEIVVLPIVLFLLVVATIVLIPLVVAAVVVLALLVTTRKQAPPEVTENPFRR